MPFETSQSPRPPMTGTPLPQLAGGARVAAVSEAIGQVAQHVARMGQSYPALLALELFLGVVVAAPAGEEEYTDRRYWVKRALPLWSLDTGDKLTVEDDLGLSSAPLIVTADNLAEWTADTHMVETGQPVTVVGLSWKKSGGAMVEQYWFTHGGGGGVAVKWGTLAADWTSGNTVTVTECTGQQDGTANGGGSWTVYLVSPYDAAPTGFDLRSGQIIGFLPFDTTNKLGHALPCKRITPTEEHQLRQAVTPGTEGFDWGRFVDTSA